MESILTKLHFLLQDMLASSKARRTRQNILMSSENPLTILDVKARVEEQYQLFQNFEPKETELTNENVALILTTRAVIYFFTRAIQVKDTEFLVETIENQKAGILSAIQFIHKNELLDENLDKEREFFEQNKQNKDKPQACESLIKGEMPEKHFDYALGFYLTVCSRHLSEEKKFRHEFVYWYQFKPISLYSNCTEEIEQFDITTNDVLLKYFFVFCDLQTINKKYIHTELPFMERRIAQNDYIHEVLPNMDINDLYQVLCIDCIIRAGEKQKLIEELVAKVFFNKYSIAFSLDAHREQCAQINAFQLFKDQPKGFKIASFKRDDYYTSPSQLFIRTLKVFGDTISSNYGILACLYMLSKEMDIDEFASIFVEEKEETFNLKSHYLKIIDEALRYESLKNAELERKGDYGKNYRRYHNIFDGYRDRIKKAKTAEIIRNQKLKQDTELGLIESSKSKKDLLQYFLWFILFEKTGLYYDNNENIYRVNSERDELLIPFCNDTMDLNYTDIAKVNQKFSSLLKFIGMENYVDLTFDKVKDFWSLILLAYNLSRIEPASKDAIVNELNYVREQQKEFLHIDERFISKREQDQNKIENDRKYNAESKINREKLKKLDCGFELKTFAQKFYPFTSRPFIEEGTKNPKDYFIYGFERKIHCKCFWETDNEYLNDGGLDWVKINSKGLETRYLYRDRNAYSHHVKFANVSALLEVTNWKNLLIALSEFYLLLEEKLWAERFDFRLTSSTDSAIQNDDFFFQNIYLQKEVEDLFYTLTLYIQECYGCKQKPFSDIIDYDKYYEAIRNGKDIKKESFTIFKCIDYTESTKTIDNPTIDYSKCKGADDEEGTFKIRLEKMLNIMFLVNDTYVSDVQSVKFMDFYSQYNMEISLYLIYMTFALNYCDDIKV